MQAAGERSSDFRRSDDECQKEDDLKGMGQGILP